MNPNARKREREKERLMNLDFTIYGDAAVPVETFCVGDDDEEVFFHIKKIYKPTKLIGEGAYGAKLCSAEVDGGKTVTTIKKIPLSFWSPKIPETLQVSREIEMLKYLNNGSHIHPCIIRLLDIMIPITKENRESKKFSEVYIVYGFMDGGDLDQLIKANELQHSIKIKNYFTQMLKAVEYMHSCNVIHRDLKPKNIVLDNLHDALQICDFGWSSYVKEGKPMNRFDVGTKYYRAPEILLGCNYDFAVDIWSLGCVFGEILLGKGIFDKGENQDELEAIISIIGIPTAYDMHFIEDYRKRDNLENLIAEKFLSEDTISTPIPPLAQKFPHVDASAIVLLEKMLSFDPMKRITATECLKNEFIVATSEKWDQIFKNQMVNPPSESDIPVYWEDGTTDLVAIKSAFYRAVEEVKREDPKVYHDLLTGCSLQFTKRS